MENKYYTPEIEEFHVGFEYESEELSPCGSLTEMVKSIIKEPQDIINAFNFDDWHSFVRVKYLDEQDILDLGFEYTNNNRDLVKDGIRVRTYIGEQFEVPNVCIYCVKNFRIFPKEELLIFKGKIKNKSELKKVLKQIEL